MDQDIVFRASVDDGKGGKSLSSLKKEFSELNKELARAEVGSEKYLATLKKLGAVKDDMGDLRDTINALNPEGKVGAFVNVAGKLAGGFQAATGAAALFGVESQELEKTLLKVQAATAFAEGIRSIAGMGDAFNVLSTVIKTNVVGALSTLKGAIIATGLGALAVAIGVLIYKTQEYNEQIEEEYGKQKKLNEELKKTTDEYLKQAKASEDLRNARRGGLNDLERELKLLEAQGATASEIAAKKLEIFDKEIFNLKVQRETIKENAEEADKLTQKILDKETEKTAAILAFQKQVADDQEKKAKDAKDKRDKARQEEMEAEEFANNFFRENDEIIAQSKATAAGEESKAKIKAAEEEAALFEQLFEEDRARLNQAAEDSKKERKERIEGEKEAAQKIAAAKLAIEQNSFKAAQNLSNLFFTTQLNKAKGNAQAELEIKKKQFNVEKAFNIARAAIDGYRAVTTAIASAPPPINFGLAAISAAATALQIANIAATKFDGGNANVASIQPPSASSSGSAPEVGTAAPVLHDQNTRLSESGKNLSINIENHISETEMTERQKRVGRLQSQAKVG